MTKFWFHLVNILMGAGLAVLLVFLLVSYINPTGIRTIEHYPVKSSKFVEGPYPPERLLGVFTENDQTFWEVMVDPVYFDLYIPRLYQKIKMIVEYKPSRQDLVQLGGVGGINWSVALYPVENSYIDSLDWPCRQLGKVRVCQNKNKSNLLAEFDTLSDFEQLAKQAQVVVYAVEDDLNLPRAVKWNPEIDWDEFDFLVTSYYPPQLLPDGWRRAQAVFRPEQLKLQNHTYQFLVSAPKLDKNNGRLKIRSVKFVLYKEPITPDNYQRKLNNFLNRLKKRIGL